MKAYLEIELIGDNTRQMFKAFSSTLNGIVSGLGDDTIGSIPSTDWVAEITGTDSLYKYSRSFLKGKRDYSRANSKGSRGVFAEYILESGKYYEVSCQKSWSKGERYFCTVNDEGDIVRIDETELANSLKKSTHSQFNGKLGMIVSEPPTQRQTSAIFEQMHLERDKALRCLGLLAKKLPGQDLASSLEVKRLDEHYTKDIENIGLWQGMEGAMKFYNYCADIVKTPHITFEYLLKGIRQWLKNQSESMSSKQPASE